MKNEGEKIDKPQGNGVLPCVSCIGVQTVILVQAITFLFSSIMWLINGDLDNWFTRWGLGMLLLSAWGVMKHLSRHYR